METEINMLSDDLVRLILMQVDVATLFRCAATCNLWRRLIAEPSFLRRYPWPPPLAGFFAQQRHQLLPGFNNVSCCSGLLTFLPSFGSSSSPRVLGRSPPELLLQRRRHRRPPARPCSSTGLAQRPPAAAPWGSQRAGRPTGCVRHPRWRMPRAARPGLPRQNRVQLLRA